MLGHARPHAAQPALELRTLEGAVAVLVECACTVHGARCTVHGGGTPSTSVVLMLLICSSIICGQLGALVQGALPQVIPQGLSPGGHLTATKA